MRSSADAVIVGGGIIGLSVAFHLARENYGNIVVLEKEQMLGAGSTSKAAGGIRAQFHNRVNIEMSMLSETLFKQFSEETGFEALFDQVGYLFLITNEKDAETFQKSHELQLSLGLNVQMLNRQEIAEVAPHMRCDDALLATYCPDDGLGDPYEFLTGYEKASRRLSVDIELLTELTSITIESGQIKSIATSRGEISTPLLINCSGAYAGLIASLAAVELPIQPYRRQCVTTGELDFISSDIPMIVDVSSGLYSHKESKGLLLGWADRAVKPGFDTSIDPDYTDSILELALDRIPKLETAKIANSWAGLYETTPDHLAVIGYEESVNGLLHVTGFSGHGFMHAPAAGVIASELVRGKTPSIEISELSPKRFMSGSLVEETNVI